MKSMTPNIEPTVTESEIAALRAGLVEARRRGVQTLIATTGPVGNRHKHVRTQLFMTTDEHAALKLMRHTLSFHVGRQVAQTLTVRLALSRLMDECRRSLSDPAAAAKMKADLLAVRAERIKATS
jgi:hypothetical protein